MNGIECWVMSIFDRTKVIAKLMLPAVPPIKGKVSALQVGSAKRTFTVLEIEHEALDFSFHDVGTKGELGRVLLFVEQ